MMLTNDMRQLSQPAGGSATGMFLIPAKQFLIDAPVCVCVRFHAAIAACQSAGDTTDVRRAVSASFHS